MKEIPLSTSQSMEDEDLLISSRGTHLRSDVIPVTDTLKLTDSMFSHETFVLLHFCRFSRIETLWDVPRLIYRLSFNPQAICAWKRLSILSLIPLRNLRISFSLKEAILRNILETICYNTFIAFTLQGNESFDILCEKQIPFKSLPSFLYFVSLRHDMYSLWKVLNCFHLLYSVFNSLHPKSDR